MDIVLRVGVFLIMTAVGLDLTTADFRRLMERPVVVVIGTVGQWLLLPVAAWAVAWLVPLPQYVVAGMVLLAGCPAGAISNYYSYLARADVALSVTLTAISSVASVFALPVVAGVGFKLLLNEDAQVSAPFGPFAIQLVLMLLIPVALGMILRRRFPHLTDRHGATIRRTSKAVLVATVVMLLIGLRGTLLDDLGATVLAAVVFTVIAGGAGVVVGLLLRVDRRQMRSLILEFACRNTAIAMVIGVVVLDRPELLVFGLVVFLTQMPIVLVGIAFAKRWLPLPFESNGS